MRLFRIDAWLSLLWNACAFEFHLKREENRLIRIIVCFLKGRKCRLIPGTPHTFSPTTHLPNQLIKTNIDAFADVAVNLTIAMPFQYYFLKVKLRWNICKLAQMLLLSWVVLALVGLIGIVKLISNRYATTAPPNGKVFRQFRTPNPTQQHLPTLSIVIPCYNEEERLPSMLHDAIEFIYASYRAPESTRFRDFEIIVVDDCSKDKTREVAAKVLSKAILDNPQMPTILHSIIPVTPNHGKGFAVRTGFFASSGDLVLMADGDNATRFGDVAKLEEAMTANGCDIAVGSRAHMEQQSIAQRTLGRTILMKLFHLVVAVTYFVGSQGCLCRIQDTQCGFKLFRRRVTEKIFLNNRLERWAFDVEVLLVARRLGILVVEVPVNWQEIPGSKVRLLGMAQMGLECLLMCFTYLLGLWPIRTERSLL